MKVVKKFWETNNFPFLLFWEYFKAATKSEKLIDFGLPAILATIGGIVMLYISISFDELIKSLTQLNTAVLSFLSILTGFSIASISVLATSNSEIINQLRKEDSIDVPKKKKFEVMMIFFSFSIVFQMLTIFLSLISLIILPLLKIDMKLEINSITIVLTSLWYYILVCALSVTVRNLKVLYHVLISEPKQSNS